MDISFASISLPSPLWLLHPHYPLHTFLHGVPVPVPQSLWHLWDLFMVPGNISRKIAQQFTCFASSFLRHRALLCRGRRYCKAGLPSAGTHKSLYSSSTIGAEIGCLCHCCYILQEFCSRDHLDIGEPPLKSSLTWVELKGSELEHVSG